MSTRTRRTPRTRRFREGVEIALEFEEVPGYGVLFDPGIVGVPSPLAGPGRRRV